MASCGSGDGFSPDQFSSEFLTCSLCLDRFKHPKVLPCQHTFCLQCLNNYVSVLGPNTISLPCPVCKEVALIPQKDPSCFRNNHHIVCLLQYIDDQKAKQKAIDESAMQPSSSTSCIDFKSRCHSNPVCSACDESKDLTSFCCDCSLWLCQICSKAHERVPATSRHMLRTMDLVDKECKEMAAVGEKTVREYKVANDENCDLVQSMLSNLPEMVQAARLKVENAGQVALKVVKEKQESILIDLERFEQEHRDRLHLKLNKLNARNRDLVKIQELLTAIKIIDDGYSNQNVVKKIDKELRNVVPLDKIHESIREAQVVHFNPFKPHLTDLERMDIGKLVFAKSTNPHPQLLHEHLLNAVKAVCLNERDYITGLAVNKLAEKFVVSNNESVSMFKPYSSAPKTFLWAQSNYIFNKPWGIAFSDSDQDIYITEAGEHEGKGTVTVFTTDGKWKSAFASGLTLPRGIAVHNGFVFVCDQIDKCVYIFNKWGKIHKVLKKTPDGKYLFVGPVFVSVCVNGNFAVTDNFCCVKIFDKHCTFLFEYWPPYPESQLWGVLVLRDGITVVCDWKHGLHQISADFETTGLIAMEGDALKEPSAIAAIDNGTIIYVGSCYGEVFSVI